MHTYHMAKTNTFTEPRGWIGHVASDFQYVETTHIFSIVIYFCQHREYFRFAYLLLNEDV